MTPTAYNDETGASPQSTASGGERGGRYAPAVAAVAVAFIVGIASRGVPVWTELSDGAAERARAMEGVLRVGLVGLAVALAATLLIHHLVIARRPGAPPLRTTLARATPLTLLSLALLGLLVLSAIGTPPERQGGGAMQLDWFPGLGLANDAVVTPGAFADAAPRIQEGAPAPPEGGRWSMLPLLALLLLVAVVVATLRRWKPRRRGAGALEAFAVEDEPLAEPRKDWVREGLRDSIAAMLVDPDPRTAVIGAYARLLEALDAGAAARHAFEAPREHLRRAMAIHHFPLDPSRALIELFELARYSRHPLTEEHRTAALAALRAVLTALETPDLETVEAAAGGGQW